MAPTLYSMPESGPCRSVLLLAKTLNLDLEVIQLDLFKGEHLTPEYLKLNPEHKVPILIDGDFTLTESRAIMIYLAEKYGKEDFLYPKDVQKRAVVNQRLFFDIDTLYRPILLHYRCLYFGAKSRDATQLPLIQEAMKVLNVFLGQNKYVAGSCLTVADISIVSTISTAIAVYDYDIKPFANVSKWYDHLSTTLPQFQDIIVKNGQKSRVMIDNIQQKSNA